MDAISLSISFYNITSNIFNSLNMSEMTVPASRCAAIVFTAELSTKFHELELIWCTAGIIHCQRYICDRARLHAHMHTQSYMGCLRDCEREAGLYNLSRLVVGSCDCVLVPPALFGGALPVQPM